MPLRPSQKLLIVDDDPDIREGFRLLLEAVGYTAEGVGNGQEALDYLHAATELPDLILLDLHMPVMDGWRFLWARAGEAAVAGIPVVVMTGERNVNQAALGAVSIIRKPVDQAALLEVIGAYCMAESGTPGS
jgi:CheY-like chemotaxis protein